MSNKIIRTNFLLELLDHLQFLYSPLNRIIVEYEIPEDVFKSNFDLLNIKKLFNDERNDLVLLARAMEESERYHDMCKIMRELVLWTYSKQIDLTIYERNLLSVAFNTVIGKYRLSWRILSRHEKMEDIIIIAYRKQVESDLECIIMNIDLLENYLIKTETKVYYLKMAGDYYRYLAEFFTEKGYEKKALNFYKLALEICENEFPPTNSFRLGLVLKLFSLLL